MESDQFVGRFADAYSSLWMHYMTLGAALVLLGLLIILMPQLLAWLVACCVIFAGASFLVVGWKIRRFRRQYRAAVAEVCGF